MAQNTPENNSAALQEFLNNALESAAWGGAKSVGGQATQQAVGAVQGLVAASGAGSNSGSSGVDFLHSIGGAMRTVGGVLGGASAFVPHPVVKASMAGVGAVTGLLGSALQALATANGGGPNAPDKCGDPNAGPNTPRDPFVLDLDGEAARI